MTETTPRNALEEFSDDELLEEMQRRYDVSIFRGYKMTSNIEAWKGQELADTGTMKRFYNGPLFAILGLVNISKIEVESAIFNIVGGPDEEEEAVD